MRKDGKKNKTYNYQDKNDDCFSRKIKDKSWEDGGLEDKLLLKAFSQIPENKREYALDVGCGLGRQIAKLLKVFHKIIAIDPDVERLTLSKAHYCNNPNVKFYNTDIQEFDFDIKFDCILSSQIIQHVKVNEVPVILKKFNSILNTSGFLILLTTNCLKEEDDFVKVDLKDAKHYPISAAEFDEIVLTNKNFLTCRLFTEKTLRNLLVMAGFEIIFVEKFNGFPKIKGDNFVFCKKINKV